MEKTQNENFSPDFNRIWLNFELKVTPSTHVQDNQSAGQ